MKQEFHAVFEITRSIIFEVNYYTLGSNRSPYFTTSANQFNRPKTNYNCCGQAQNELLHGHALAHLFYRKWDKLHLKDLTDVQYSEMRYDLTLLEKYYNMEYTERNRGFNLSELRELSKRPLKNAAK